MTHFRLKIQDEESTRFTQITHDVDKIKDWASQKRDSKITLQTTIQGKWSDWKKFDHNVGWIDLS